LLLTTLDLDITDASLQNGAATITQRRLTDQNFANS
jgi:hypothetical protein